MPTMAECNILMDEASKTLLPCPCCGKKAFVRSHDYMTVSAICGNVYCRLKAERGVINSRSFQRCVKMVVRVWNKRKAPRSTEGEQHQSRQATPG